MTKSNVKLALTLSKPRDFADVCVEDRYLDIVILALASRQEPSLGDLLGVCRRMFTRVKEKEASKLHLAYY